MGVHARLHPIMHLKVFQALGKDGKLGEKGVRGVLEDGWKIV
jgi:hypothetical protein